MHRESNSVIRLSIIILTILLSFHSSPSFCRKKEKIPSCNKPFSCGKFKNLSYPFWKNNVSQDCRFPGFELYCNGKTPLLEISQLSFQVLEINFTTYTLKLAREDLSNNICTNNTYNTTLNPKLFEFSSNSGHKIITLFYNCTHKYNHRPSQKTLPNQFSCVRFGSKSLNLFKIGDPSSGPGPDFSCTYNISVPVNREAARALEMPTASSINVLKSALANGFFVRWSTDNEYCEGCRYNRKTALSVVSIPASMPLPVGYMLPTSRAPPPGLTRYVGPTSRAPTPGSGENRNIVATSPAPTPGLGETEGFGPIIQTPVDAPQSDGPSAEPPYDQGEHSAIIGNRVKVTIAIVITGTTILSVIIFVLLKTRSSPRAPTSNQDVENFLVQNGTMAPKRYKYSEIKKITKSFKEKLGQGGYGSVYKGTLANGGQVAVKILIETNSNGEEFINEVASISRTSHVNIVSLFGFCYDRKKGKRALVYEYMPNKSLDTLISNTSSTNCLIDDKKMYEIALGVAKGLEYLHTGCNTRIVHFDIKPQNILLDEDLCPKISDFGLAKLCKKKQSILSVVGTRGTIGYIAPEVFSRNFGGVSHKSDVYSYGMMLLEMAGAKKITGNDDEIQSSENYFPDRLYERVIMNVIVNIDDLEVGEEKEEQKKMFMVGFWCIQTSPSDRPSISKVVEMLEGNVESIQIPPKPVLFAPPVSMLEFSSSYTEYSAEN